MNQEWLRPAEAAEYSSVSLRTLYVWLKSGLKHSRVTRTVLIKKTALDEYISGYEVPTEGDVDAIVTSVLDEMLR